jgi:hypothetical protein
MDIFELGALGDILSSLGVLASLIYLSIQVRQHTSQQKKLEVETRSAAVNASALALRENRIGVYQDGEFAAIYHVGLSSPDELPEVDYLRFRIHMQNVLDGLWDIHSQTVCSGVSEEIWRTLGEKAIERMISTPGGRKVWAQMATAYPAEFRQAVDTILSQN